MQAAYSPAKMFYGKYHALRASFFLVFGDFGLLRVVYKRIGFRREWYTKGQVLDEIGIQKDTF